jgi:integrase/recombinase XerC/integrase/recombinase XerD
VSDLRRGAQDWLEDGRSNRLSRATLAAREFLTGKFLWWCGREQLSTVGLREVRRFLAYVNIAHEYPEGRWGIGLKEPVRPRTAETYFTNLKMFFRWLVEEGEIEASPMEGLKPPPCRRDQIRPFTEDEIERLLAATKGGYYPARDEAIIRFLLDTGCRAAEVISLRVEDVDLEGKPCRVTGKGEKARTVFFGIRCRRALWNYLKTRKGGGDTGPLFVSGRGGEALTRWGLTEIIGSVGARAKLTGVRCSPHTFRHTCAILSLRHGMNLVALSLMLGHENIRITQNYLALAEADIEDQHARFSPGDRLRRR